MESLSVLCLKKIISLPQLLRKIYDQDFNHSIFTEDNFAFLRLFLLENTNICSKILRDNIHQKREVDDYIISIRYCKEKKIIFISSINRNYFFDLDGREIYNIRVEVGKFTDVSCISSEFRNNLKYCKLYNYSHLFTLIEDRILIRYTSNYITLSDIRDFDFALNYIKSEISIREISLLLLIETSRFYLFLDTGEDINLPQQLKKTANSYIVRSMCSPLFLLTSK